jgi:hypothetical protein
MALAAHRAARSFYACQERSVIKQHFPPIWHDPIGTRPLLQLCENFMPFKRKLIAVIHCGVRRIRRYRGYAGYTICKQLAGLAFAVTARLRRL